MRSTTLVLALALVIIVPLWPQGDMNQSPEDDPVSYIGLTLTELIGRFGVPRSVYPSRGPEEWQDDVVFVYEQGDFYILKDRVWQVSLKAARGIKAGDSMGTVYLTLGSKAESRFNSVYCTLDEGSWPMMLRFDFNSEGRVQVIFIYRTDL